MTLSLIIGRFAAEPDEVTAILGLRPTRAVRVGDQLPSGGTSSINSWELNVSDVAIEGGVAHHASLRKIVDIIDGKESAFRSLRDRIRPELMSIVGEIVFPTSWLLGEHGVWMDARDMRALADCGLAWGVDIHLVETEHE